MATGGPGGLPELFEPKSIAVIGASRRPGSVGASLFHNILAADYSGVVYPVNPRWTSVGGVPCYPSVEALPATPDLAIIIVPAVQVNAAVESLGKRGTKGVVVISSGFKEVGGEGIELERTLMETARRYGMTVVGPNCFGLINTDPDIRLNATFSDTIPTPGNIAFISQSGALGAGILHYAKAAGLGFSKFVSVGNRAGVDENTLLNALAKDEATRVILLYVESLAQGRRFLEVARTVTESKPVVVIKSGRSPMGEAAARSHTGSLAHANSDRLFDAVFAQAGVLRAQSISELFQMAKVFTTGGMESTSRLAILTNSGGPGILAADAAARAGLSMAPLPENLQTRLRKFVSPYAAVRNPVDVTADATVETYRSVLKELFASPEVDAVLFIGTPTGAVAGDAVVQALIEGRGESPKTLAACLFGVSDLSEEFARLEARGIPCFTFPEEAVTALGSAARYAEWRGRPRTDVVAYSVDSSRARQLLEAAVSQGRLELPEHVAREVLACYGFPLPPSRLVTNAEEASKAADEMGYPVVLKVASPAILHKTDVGGVALHLSDGASVRQALTTMAARVHASLPQAPIDGFVVEKEIVGGKEVILGMNRDPDFGPVVLFGLGGIYVEVLKDVTFRLAPLRALSADHMISSIQGYRLLQGVRGEPPADLPALREAIERLSQLATEQSLIQELDVNPLVVLPTGKGAWALDARIVLARRPA